jgi:hypothetical protein
MNAGYFDGIESNAWHIAALPRDPALAAPQDMEAVFTLGQCHALAMALQDLTGWDLIGFFGGGLFTPGDVPGHVAVIDPDGTYHDVNGPQDDPDVFVGRYGRPADMTRAEVEDLAARDVYYPPRMDCAAVYAAHLAREWGVIA